MQTIGCILQAMIAKVIQNYNRAGVQGPMQAFDYPTRGCHHCVAITVSQPELWELVRIQVAHKSHSSGRAPLCSSAIRIVYGNN